MNADELLDLLGEVDDSIIVETKDPRMIYKRRWWIAIAACFCLVIGSITAVSATGFGTRLIESFTAREEGKDYKESGFDLSVSIVRVHEEDLSEELQKVGNTIRGQFEECSPFDNWYPGEWQKEFKSRNQACEYVGLKQIKPMGFDWEEQATTLSVLGNEQGRIQEVGIETDYKVEDIRMQLFTQIYTSQYSEEISIGTRTTEDIDFSESYFITDGDARCQVIQSSVLESGYLSMDGYIVEDGVLYNLNIMYLEKDASQAQELIHLWAESF